MKIKRLTALMLCMVIVFFALSGCDDTAGIDDYDWTPDVIVELEYDLYIITDSLPSEDAISAQKTVNSKINQHIDEKYNTTINIHYKSADEYESVINSIVNSSAVSPTATTVISEAGRQKAGTIVLINSKEMHDYLVNEEKLVDLKPYLDTKEFGRLNIQITQSLLEAAMVKVGGDTDSLYALPNDHPIGEYHYTLINRSIAEGQLNFSAQSEILDMHILDGVPNDEANELVTLANENFSLLGISDIKEVIREEKGNYEDKAKWEEQGYICNVTKYPEATVDDAMQSAFGILKAEDIYYDGELLISAADCHRRAMQVIYEINSDTTVRNLLQYGVENTHYTLEDGNTVIPYESSAYKMNLLYTGDMFNAYYCADNVWICGSKGGAWTKDVVDYASKQNSEVKASD